MKGGRREEHIDTV